MSDVATSSSRAPGARARRWFTSLKARLPGGWTFAVGSTLIVFICIVTVIAPLIAPYPPLDVAIEDALLPPSWAHWFGTDESGRDVLSRILYGGRVSLKVSLLAALIGSIGGVVVGLIAAFKRGTILDHLIMRTIDAVASIPLLIWAIAIVGLLGVNVSNWGPFVIESEDRLLVLLGFLYMPTLARVTYIVAQAEFASDYVRASRMQGAGSLTIIFSDVLPNCLSPIIVQVTLLVAIGVVLEASVGFIGLGVQPPTPSWGSMLADARNYIFSGEWWLSVLPGAAISLTVIAFNLVGDGLRDFLDPRQRLLEGVRA